MSKHLALVLPLLVIIGIGLVLFAKNNGSPAQAPTQTSTAATQQPARSYLDATYLIDGTPVTLSGGHASVPAAPGSASMVTTDEYGNQEVAGDEWFDAAHFPRATFVSTRIQPAANGAYSVAGKLTIRGKTTDVVVPVQYHKDGADQVFDGALPVKRLVYGIGTGEWKDTSVVADDVQIKFHIVTAAH